MHLLKPERFDGYWLVQADLLLLYLGQTKSTAVRASQIPGSTANAWPIRATRPSGSFVLAASPSSPLVGSLLGTRAGAADQRSEGDVLSTDELVADRRSI